MSWLQTGEITRGDACSWLRLERGGKGRRLVGSATPGGSEWTAAQTKGQWQADAGAGET